MGAPAAPRHVVTAHLAAIIQGAVHLGLTTAVGLATLPAWVEVLGALLLVSGSALFVAGATLNWLQRVGDHFAARSVGWRLLWGSGPLHLTGLAVVVVGVVRAVAPQPAAGPVSANLRAARNRMICSRTHRLAVGSGRMIV